MGFLSYFFVLYSALFRIRNVNVCCFGEKCINNK